MKPRLTEEERKKRAERTAKAFARNDKWIRLKDKQTGDIVRVQEYRVKEFLKQGSRYQLLDKLS
jgi:hypothetical protein